MFHDNADYQTFLKLVNRAQARCPLDILALCLMPNHFHFVVRPVDGSDLSHWMHWLLTAHVRRHHLRYGTYGRIWQGRFKPFPIQEDRHLLTVLRYVERNALRSGLVERAERWSWGSLNWRTAAENRPVALTEPPIALPADWLDYVNQPEYQHEVIALRRSETRGTPFGDPDWVRRTARKFKLETTLRGVGRPAKARN